jgi:hypothetical protein
VSVDGLMRNSHSLMRKHASAYLVVAAVYGLIFSLGWLMAMVHFKPSEPLAARQGSLGQERGSGSLRVGKLVVVGPEGCRYGEFSNIRDAAFEVTTADCDSALSSLGPAGTPEGHRVDRIEAIGRYFRGD